ncbi:DUF397 domain-containing protein [Streptomyces sp. NPDC005438]|uniref:DUF397 domain-containing protein n=1 Tax=Streptomyces sp. NPDC005438 TaxID=3156880 RepID=UPI0033A98973
MNRNQSPAKARWRKSSYSQPNGGECVEVATNLASTQGVVPVRDSKDVTIPGLTASVNSWRAFVAQLKD